MKGTEKKAFDGHDKGINFGIHYGPHYDFGSGEFKIGPSIGLGLDF